MARVLICEPHDDIRALLELVVRRVGHEPVVYAGDDPGDDVAAAVIEPGEPSGMRLARLMRTREVPLLFTSIYPAGDEARALTPSSYLVKPFPLYALELALKAALAEAARVQAAAV